MENLFKWAREAEQPLRTYAIGLLGGAMENQDIAANYRDENSQLVRSACGYWGLYSVVWLKNNSGCRVVPETCGVSFCSSCVFCVLPFQ